MKKLLILLFALAMVGMAFADVIVGTGTSTQRQPFGAYFGYERSASIYLASEINATGTITHLKWYVGTGQTTNVPTKIYITTTTGTTLAATTWAGITTGLTPVYDATLNFPTAGWQIIDITDFSYTGDNLLVLCETNYGGGGIGTYPNFRYTTATAKHQQWATDTTAPTGNGTVNANRPNITFVGISPAIAILNIDPSSIAFGTGYLGSTKQQLVTLTNTGGAPMTIAAGGITIAGHADFTMSAITLPVTLNPGGAPLTFTVYYMPTAAGAQTATVTIVDSRATTPIPVTGTGAVLLEGEICENPYIISSSPTSYNASTVGYANDYTSAMFTGLTSTNYVSGLDWVAKLVLPSPKQVAINVADQAGYTSQYLGVYLVGSIPSLAAPAAVLGQATAGSGTVTIPTTILPAGTYYIIVDNWPSPTNIYFTLNVTYNDPPTGPPNAVTLNLPADLATGVAVRPTFTWTAPASGAPVTGYNLYMNTTDGSTLFASNVSSPYTLLSNLPYSTQHFWTVKAYNGDGVGPAAAVRSFTTIADPTVTTFPWSVDFGTLAADWRPINWTQYSGVLADPSVLVAGGGSWYQDDWLNVTAPLNKAAKINLYGTTAQGWVVSPPIAMPGAGYQLEFDVAYMAWNGVGTPPVADGTDDRFEVLIGDGLTWTPANIVRSWDNAGSAYVLNSISPSGDHVTIDISAYTGVKYIAFYCHNGTVGDRDNDLMFDNVVVRTTPVGAPEVVTLNSPADGATGLSNTGFNITWSAALTGGTADYYGVYMSMDEENIYGDIYFETTATSLNPTTYANGPSPAVTFAYGDRWYWTVEAVNGTGSAVVEPARWFEIENDPSITVFPYLQTFASGAFPPASWTLASAGSNVWMSAPAVNGFGAVENMGSARANFYSQSSSTPYDLITAPINLDGMAGLLTFDHAYASYAGENDQLEIMASSNGVDYSSIIVYAGGADGPLATAAPQTATFVPTAAQWATKTVNIPVGTTHVKFRAISAYGNDLYVDNIGLDQTVAIPHDVAVTAIYNMSEVTSAVSVTPKATVKNWGINTETFDVSIVIGSYTNTQTVVALAPTATAEVTFASFVPTVMTAENVVVTSLLATDEVAGNNELTSVLICLPLDKQAYGDVAWDGAGSPGPATFNLSTPGTVTDLPSANPWNGQFLAGADWMNGAWIGAEYYDVAVPTSGNYWQVDPVTGAGTVLGPYAGASMSGVAYDEVNNIVYATNGTSLYTMSSTGVPTLIGALHLQDEVTAWAGLMIGIAYDSFTNVMYGVDLGYDFLFTINLADGLCTPVGSLGIGLNYAQDCAFDRDNGLLYLAGYTSTGALYWIDTVGGGAYKVGDFQNGAEMCGFAIPYTSGGLEAPVVTIAADGTLSWPAVDGATMYIVSSSDDPYGTFTFEENITATSWLDPAPAAKKFYQVKASDAFGGRAQRARIQGLNNIAAKSSALRATPANRGIFNPLSK